MSRTSVDASEATKIADLDILVIKERELPLRRLGILWRPSAGGGCSRSRRRPLDASPLYEDKQGEGGVGGGGGVAEIHSR